MNSPPRTALLVIDVQANMFDPSNPVVDAAPLLERIARLIDVARGAGAPVFFVRNCGGPGDPDQRGTPGWELHHSLAPAANEPVLDKTTCDTFASTNLDGDLRARGVGGVAIAGLQSEWCIRETTLGALERGYEVTLVSDAHSTYDGKTRSAAKIRDEVNDEVRSRARLARADEVRL